MRRAAGRLSVAGTPVRDLLLRAKHLFVAAVLAGWTASEPPHFSRNGTPPRDENRRCIPSTENCALGVQELDSAPPLML